MIVQAYKLVYISNTVANLADRWVLKTSFWVLTSIIEDTRLLLEIVKLQRLELASFA